MLNQGKINISVDGKYPQAIGTSQILSLTSAFGNSHWEILINEHKDSPFFTSDFPVAVEFVDTQILRVFPITPYLAIRVFPYLDLEKDKHELDFPHFNMSIKKPNRKEISSINQRLVYCAEEIVLFSEDQRWIRKFIGKNSGTRLVNKSYLIPHGSGTLKLTSLAYENLTTKAVRRIRSAGS